MKKVFTLILSFVMVSFATLQVNAQINVDSPFPVNFEIDAPADIAGTYPFGTQSGDWGPQVSQDVRGALAWVRSTAVDADGNEIPGVVDSLGCSEILNPDDIKGKMAYIRRGACFFSVKILNAQKAGAIGVIIANHYDNADDDQVSTLNMSPSTEPADSFELVTIPGIFVSRATGELITPELDAGNEVIGAFDVQSLYDAFGPYAYQTPQSQIITLDEVSIKYFNDDPDNSISTSVTLDITEPNGTVTSYSETIDVEPLTVDTIDFPDFTPTDMGTYTMVWKNAANDSEQSHTFEITEHTFGVDAGPDANGDYDWIAPTDQGFIDDGSKYDFGSTFITGADGMVTGITFGLNNPGELFTGNPTADVFTVVLYDVDPTGTTPLTGQEDSYDSFGLLEFGGYTLTGDEQPGDLICVSLFAPAAVQADKVYMVVVQYDGNNAGIGVAPQYLMSGATNYPYFGTTVFTDRFYSGGWAGGSNGVVRMQMEGYNCTTTSTDDLALDASKVNVFPNPANEVVNVELNLAEVADQVEIQMVSVTGKVLEIYNYENVKSETYQFNIDNLANGTYFMHIRTSEGTRAQKFSVLR